MERPLAWYRVGSSLGAVAALLIANAIPLVGVLFLGWNVYTILTIYWLENGVVGFYNVLKMARAEGSEGDSDSAFRITSGSAANFAKPMMIPFFVVDYGLFWLVHGVFVLTLPLFAGFGGGFGAGLDAGLGAGVRPSELDAGEGAEPVGILIVLVGLFISHGLSFWLNYIRRGEFRRATVAGQMFAPYGRLVVLHLTILFGGIGIALSGAPVAAIVVLVAVKVVMDLGFHLAEHRGPRPASA